MAHCGKKLSAAIALTAWVAAGQVQAAELLANGGFEANVGLTQSPDPITGWNTLEAGLIGGVATLPGLLSPGSGHSTAGASAGAQYALPDLSQPAYAVLYQSFAVSAFGIASGQLGYKLFATSFAGLTPPDLALNQGLNYESPDPMLTVRVDILKPGADPLSMNSADIVSSYLPTVNYAGSDAAPTAYGSYLHTLNATDFVAGQNYTLRFAASGNAGQLLVGIDNVSLNVTAVPEPTTWALLAAGLALVGTAARRRA